MRINFFAGPGAGKSTTTARVFAQLKERNLSVEHVGEYVKSWAYQKRPVNKWDQLYVFGKQQQYEYRFLSNDVKNIVTDSPCLLSAIYSLYNNTGLSGPIESLCHLYDNDHPCINIFLRRNDKPYVQGGRYQTAEDARELDTYMLSYLKIYDPKVIELDYQSQDEILNTVLAVIDR